MTVIKQHLLRQWDTSFYPVRICCIKFVQRVIQVQTPGVIADPRVRSPYRPVSGEVYRTLTSCSGPTKMKRLSPLSRAPTRCSLCPTLKRKHLVFLIDCYLCSKSPYCKRSLALTDEHALTSTSDPLLVNATLNCLAVLIRTRQSISHKILTAVLEFNPWKQANASITPTLRIGMKSMERTTKALILNTMKRCRGSLSRSGSVARLTYVGPETPTTRSRGRCNIM